nr:CvpA family protein [Bacteroidales bacterium]
MNLFDIIITLILIIAGGRGFFNGFIHQASSLISMILGIWTAYTFCGKAAGFLLKYIEINPAVVNVVAFALIFIAVSVVVGLIGK